MVERTSDGRLNLDRDFEGCRDLVALAALHARPVLWGGPSSAPRRANRHRGRHYHPKEAARPRRLLDPLVARQWLYLTAIDLRMISAAMQPFTSELMEAYEVSRLVNDLKNDSPACINPATPERPGPLFDC
jgi:hypothetical protein